MDGKYPVNKKTNWKINTNIKKVLGFEKPLLGEKSAREKVFRGLKQRFLSNKTQFFFKKSVHKGLNYICEFFGKDLSLVSVFK